MKSFQYHSGQRFTRLFYYLIYSVVRKLASKRKALTPLLYNQSLLNFCKGNTFTLVDKRNLQALKHRSGIFFDRSTKWSTIECKWGAIKYSRTALTQNNPESPKVTTYALTDHKMHAENGTYMNKSIDEYSIINGRRNNVIFTTKCQSKTQEVTWWISTLVFRYHYFAHFTFSFLQFFFQFCTLHFQPDKFSKGQLSVDRVR